MYLTGSIVFLLYMYSISLSSGWVLTDIDYPRLRRVMDLDSENEVDSEDMVAPRFSLIYPGTKWCGPGSIAESYDDLGSERETDMCCRDHDNCPDVLLSGESKHGLTNDAYYTRLNCECDERFRQCLRGSNNRTSASKIGTIYFDVLNTKCYREDYPVVGCRKRGGWLNKKCLEPEFDKNGQLMYQWFDVPNF